MPGISRVHSELNWPKLSAKGTLGDYRGLPSRYNWIAYLTGSVNLSQEKRQQSHYDEVDAPCKVGEFIQAENRGY